MSPLRIAMTSYYLPSESKIGAGHMAHRLARVMTERGHEVTMFSPCAKPDDASYDHVAIPLAGSLRTFRWPLAIRTIDMSSFDVYHAHGDNHLRRRRATPPTVRTLHGSCFSEALHIRGAKERLRMFLLGLTEVAGTLTADASVAVSRNTTWWFPWVRTVIPNGVDLDLFHPGDKEPDPTILFVGTYERRKRGRLLMNVFESEIRPDLPDAQLWMVCSDAPVAPGVEVLGRLDDDELADRYRRAWVFCLPSTYEGFGVPYIEAMASGTAVVATPNPGSNEVLARGRHGLISRDDRLGTELLHLLSSPGSCQRIASEALLRSRIYSWEMVADAYEQLYWQLAK